MEKESASFFLIIPAPTLNLAGMVALFYESCIFFFYAEDKFGRNVGIYGP